MISCTLLETNKNIVEARRKLGLRSSEIHIYNKTIVIKVFNHAAPIRVFPPMYNMHIRFDVHYEILIPTEVSSIYDFHVIPWELV